MTRPAVSSVTAVLLYNVHLYFVPVNPLFGDRDDSALGMTAPSHSAGSGVRRRRTGQVAANNQSPPSGDHPISSGRDVSLQPISVLPEADRHRSLIARLWLESRLTRAESTGKIMYQLQGHDRPLSIGNLRIAFQLAKALRIPLIDLLWKSSGWNVVFYFTRKMIQGTIPAGRIWAQAKMMDLVQQSLEKGGVELTRVFMVAATSLAFTTFDAIYDFVARRSDERVREAIDHSLQRAYLAAQMSLSIPAMSTPYVSALMYEAEVFVSTKEYTTRNGDTWNDANAPFDAIEHFVRAITGTIELVTQLSLLVTALLGSETQSWGLGRMLMIFFSLGPTILRLCGDWFMKRRRRRRSRKDYALLRRLELFQDTLREMGTSGNYKQENVLFGLKEWVLMKWDEVGQAKTREEQRFAEARRVKDLGLSLSKTSMETMFNVMLALRITGSAISLGTVRLYQSIAMQLTSTLRRFSSSLERAYQTIFYLAAYVEATTNPEGTELALRQGVDNTVAALIDYETIRGDGGLSITARNIRYTYPTASRPALRDINIKIHPGETLAIVGFNGGGKSTLVKVLMGLYNHDVGEGELLINGVPVQQIDPVSLHKRTSCLFQNFDKYPLSLRENIGIGSFEYMADDDMIQRAVTRGGAEAVKSRVGLDGRLIPDEMIEVDDDPASGVLDDAVEGAEDDQGIDEDGGTRDLAQSTPADDGTDERSMNGVPATSANSHKGLVVGRGQAAAQTLPIPDGKGSAAAKLGRKTAPDTEDKRTGLSGGQWQRVALARAFLRSDEADLVIFDEPSASLDPRAEAALFQRIHALSTAGGKRATTIYISHRFSTVRKADQIAVVEDGTIIESGSHSELMALEGRYAELFNLQREGYEE